MAIIFGPYGARFRFSRHSFSEPCGTHFSEPYIHSVVLKLNVCLEGARNVLATENRYVLLDFLFANGSNNRDRRPNGGSFKWVSVWALFRFMIGHRLLFDMGMSVFIPLLLNDRRPMETSPAFGIEPFGILRKR